MSTGIHLSFSNSIDIGNFGISLGISINLNPLSLLNPLNFLNLGIGLGFGGGGGGGEGKGNDKFKGKN